MATTRCDYSVLTTLDNDGTHHSTKIDIEEFPIVTHPVERANDRARLMELLNQFHRSGKRLSTASLERLYTRSFLGEVWDVFYLLHDFYGPELEKRRNSEIPLLNHDPRNYLRLAQSQFEAIRDSRYDDARLCRQIETFGLPSHPEDGLLVLEHALGISLESLFSQWIPCWSSVAIRSFAAKTPNRFLRDALARSLIKNGSLGDLAWMRRHGIVKDSYGLSDELIHYLDGLEIV